MKLSLILEAVDRWSAPARRAQQSTQRLTSGLGGLASQSMRARSQSTQLDRVAGRLPSILTRANAAATRFARAGLTGIERGASHASRAIDAVALRAGRFAIGGAGLLAAGGVAATGMFARGVISNGAQFEQYRVQLETALHSAKAAQDAIRFIQKFAADTPYEIGEVMTAFITAKNQGIDPFNGAMTDIGDKASSVGRSFEDVALAVGDAMRAQWERLLDLGIVGSTHGSKVALQYFDRNGKQVSKSVAKDATKIRDTLLGIFRESSGGGMARQSKTLLGIWSNLTDKVTNFEVSVANKGIFDRVKGRLQEVLDWADRLEKEGKLDAWAQRASDEMTKLFDRADRFVREVDWKAVADGVGSITSALVTTVEWIGKATKAWGELNRIGAGIDKRAGFDNTGNSIESKIWSALTWDPFDAMMSGPSKSTPAPQPAKPRPAIPNRRGVWERALQNAPSASSPLMKPARMQVDIHLKGDGAKGAQVQKISTPGHVTASVSRSVSRGPAMGGAA
ncbi:hypothetical protein [uncultured Sphingomonas sp.]|mgnify:CR=1 FL=1|uniref:hypothetical protein n=1 Tax=uncultured Sphingomonas sp. TaxID=158754 RepID=UPI0026003BF1|nr:hypothetical protein [uncultured Sphingomonas sp.]